jgi:hypothetical protein
MVAGDVTGDKRSLVSVSSLPMLTTNQKGLIAETGPCCFFEFAEVDAHHAVRLRLAPTKNNQAAGIRWARDFEFAAKLALPRGAVAQLGERLAGSQ